MIKPKHYMKFGLAGGLVAASMLLVGNHGVFAADHQDAPGTTADESADIADFYVWSTEHDTIVAVVTFAGLRAVEADAAYDADVLYGIHIDNNGDNMADIDIWARFGQNAAGEWGLQVVNLPGADADVDPKICGGGPGHCGPVETTIDTGSGTRVRAGIHDDPFFFDHQGYTDTIQSGTLSFDHERDTFAGLNVTAIVVEMDAAAAAGGSNNIQMWATTARR